MLATALIVTLATAPPPSATLPRVPGMRLRLGMTEGQVLAAGSFITLGTPEGAAVLRKGPARFFGVLGEATVVLRGGLLSEVRFEANGVGAHSQDYVNDQLRMLSLERQCQTDEPGSRVCDLTSSSFRLHLEMTQGRVSAHTFPWPPPPDAGTPGGADSAAAGGAAPAPVATLPETLTITPASRNRPDAWPRILPGPPVQYPEKAKQESIQGVVWMIALVDTSGVVMNAAIERGIPELNQAALAWVRSTKFSPCRRNDAPCRYAVRVPAYFTLY